MKEEGIVGRRRFSMCGGTGSVPPERQKLIRNASFGGYNEITDHHTGNDITNSLTVHKMMNCIIMR